MLIIRSKIVLLFIHTSLLIAEEIYNERYMRITCEVINIT